MLNVALEAHEPFIKELGGRQVKVHIPVSAFYWLRDLGRLAGPLKSPFECKRDPSLSFRVSYMSGMSFGALTTA